MCFCLPIARCNLPMRRSMMRPQRMLKSRKMTNMSSIQMSNTFVFCPTRLLFCPPAKKEVGDLRVLGVGVDMLSVETYSIARIFGVHFKSGEWGNHPRCGSVITVVNDGRSLYGRVSKFFSVNGNSCPGYASVTWFGFPTYPFDNPLVVRVHKNGDELDDRYGCIIPITLIDPSPIVIEPDTDGLHYFMMRLSGYDTIRS